MKNNVFILFFTLVINQLPAQTLAPSVLVSAGRFQEVSGVSLNYTIGEPMIPTTIVGGTLLTFGFNQPENILNAVVDVDGKNLIINAFPNPVIDDLTIDVSEALTQSLVVTLSDIHGKKMYSQKADIGTLQLHIPTKDVPQGVYFVEMRQANGAFLHAFKIVKSL